MRFITTEFPWKGDPTKDPNCSRPLTDTQENREQQAVLHLFSGPFSRKDGLQAHLQQHNITCINIDKQYGGDEHDLLSEQVYERLQHMIKQGKIRALVAAPPCSTYSVARFLPGGPPPLRTYEHPDGLPLDEIPNQHHNELRAANEIAKRTCHLANLIHEHGGQFVIENPAPRHCKELLGGQLYYKATGNHGSLWTTTPVLRLAKRTKARLVTFAYCMLGHQAQKYTSLLYTLCTPQAYNIHWGS